MNIKELPENFITLYSTVFKSIYLETKNEKLAKEKSWQAILDKYEVLDGQWKIKSPKASFEMFITKAAIDSDGKRSFSMSASDIFPDVFGEKMSIKLYESFVKRINGGEFVSLAHYPRLNQDKAVLGYITKAYIDGNIFKTRGYFLDNKLGTLAYNSIREDRRNNVPFDKRVRVSIGFYDYAHQHEDFIWRKSENDYCPICANKNTIGKTYLDGKLDHCALTRVPARKTTEIEING